MRIGHIELFSRDVSRARRFYVDVLGAVDVQPEAEAVAWMQIGTLEILLRPGEPAETPATYGAASQGIVLYVDDLDAARSALVERGLAFEGTDGSPLCLTFRDPDGHWFQLVDPESH